uniref:Ubiquitin-like protease family profile domain-containing protein n=1 Tax=Setaria viridis TaxID=4556 RepID=A0A4U6TF69_SETVI|nr:hypothetical protein SEVIR_8G058600v2 [Setaria viridis]
MLQLKLEKQKVNGKGVDLSCNDLSCLEDKKDVFDSVIDFVYARISLTFASEKDILLVRLNHAYLMGNLSEKADLEYHAKSLDLQSRRMVLVPVNDNTDYMRAEGEKHWSLLVIHIAEDHSSCRFVHHDSVSSGLNHTAAVKYANALKQVLPKAPPVIEADTPKQLNGSNCGLCVLALSKAICTWWIKRERPGKSNCWEINSKITGNDIAAMRVKLRHNLMEEIQALSNDLLTGQIFC